MYRLSLATTLALSSTVVGLATDDRRGSSTGTGSLEGTVDNEKWSVVLPVVETDDTTFNFILDPEGLIKQTKGERYTDETFEDGANVFFTNTAEGKTYDHSSTSDSLTATNKSTMAVEITVSATVKNYDGITLTTDKTFANDKNASLYLALADGTNTKAVDTTGSASITSKINAAADGAYKTKWNADSEKYELVESDEAKEDDYDGFSSYTFNMTGKCNAAGDWSKLATVAPTVEVTWSVAEYTEKKAPSIATTSYTLAKDTPIEVAVDLGKGDLAATGISGITFTSSTGAAKTLATSSYTLADGKLTFAASYINTLIGVVTSSRVYTVKFKDSASTTVEITLLAPETTD